MTAGLRQGYPTLSDLNVQVESDELQILIWKEEIGRAVAQSYASKPYVLVLS